MEALTEEQIEQLKRIEEKIDDLLQIAEALDDDDEPVAPI